MARGGRWIWIVIAVLAPPGPIGTACSIHHAQSWSGSGTSSSNGPGSDRRTRLAPGPSSCPESGSVVTPGRPGATPAPNGPGDPTAQQSRSTVISPKPRLCQPFSSATPGPTRLCGRGGDQTQRCQLPLTHPVSVGGHAAERLLPVAAHVVPAEFQHFAQQHRRVTTGRQRQREAHPLRLGFGREPLGVQQVVPPRAHQQFAEAQK